MKFFVAYVVTTPGGIHSHHDYGNTMVERDGPLQSIGDIRAIEKDLLQKVPMGKDSKLTVVSFQKLEESAGQF